MGTFVFGSKSRLELQGVHPALVAVFERAISLSRVDFTMTDGLRTEAEQKVYVQQGVSKTMNSKHRIQGDGWGHAGDAVPVINGKPRWEWEPIYDVAAAVQQAAIELNTAIRWGGCWDRDIRDIGKGREQIKAAVAAYCQRHPGPDFIDGPHYELM